MRRAAIDNFKAGIPTLFRKGYRTSGGKICSYSIFIQVIFLRLPLQGGSFIM